MKTVATTKSKLTELPQEGHFGNLEDNSSQRS
jgi:hypothetical protein